MNHRREDPDRPAWETHRSPESNAEGDAAFTMLFERRFGQTARRLSGMSDPEDAAITAFIREYYLRSRSLNTNMHFANYMFASACWESIRAFRRTLPANDDCAEIQDTHSLLQAVDRNDPAWIARLRWAFPALSEEEVIHIHLRVILRLHPADIADYLRIAPGTAYTRWHRLARKVKTEYDIELSC